jgi:phosphatidylethanolamine/phosphatidyl-N-methylethanolamine N-methyltransferase
MLQFLRWRPSGRVERQNPASTCLWIEREAAVSGASWPSVTAPLPRLDYVRIVMTNAVASYLHFMCAALVKFRQTGAIVPSQRFLISKMIAPVPEGYSGRIIELGAGSGALTLRLAARCPRARILACEINPALARNTRHNLDLAGINGRVEVISDSAEHLLSEMGRRRMEKADYILSGIPLGNLPGERALALIDAISQALGRKGMYIQFQYSLIDRNRIRTCFKSLRTVPVLLNIPPAVVYYAQK